MLSPILPGPGQESVWDYPRPPRWQDSSRHLQVVFNGVVIADSSRARRVLETSHPPVYYIPPEDVQIAYLQPLPRTSLCEWKGEASYFSVAVGDRQVEPGAWCYHHPTPPFAEIAGYIAFYPARMDGCYLDGQLVEAQPGDFYGGWISADIVGPFKGGPGTWGW
ncbi:MAG: DUF427 domain-containing protein [Cyanobacteria bacterium REEB459]|nr:DUF427 domain-containing protein [Cyanobacteria bacterium REEB459]